MVLSILYDHKNDGKESHLLDSLGFDKISSESNLWDIEDIQLNLADVVGNVCSYFSYYGCPIESTSQECSKDELVLFIVLTDVQSISAQQLQKLTEIGGGLSGDQREIHDKAPS